MMRLTNRNNDIGDLRTFLKTESDSLPFPSHKDVKIQARSFNLYNATLPNREEIRRDNYNRRKEQISSMGLKTPFNEPYKIIGDPLYLDHKRIILYGLGRHDDIEKDAKNDSEPPANLDKKNKILSKSLEHKKTFNIKNLRRTKELFKIKDEEDRIKEYIKGATLGQSFFDNIQNMKEIKVKSTMK
jgi:hypothetical protein